MTCEELRSIAADVALDDVTGAERAAALAHLESCERCRALVADLAGAADAVLLLAPPVEPPPGFESRALARMGGTAPARRRRPVVLAVAAALVAAIAGGVVGAALADDAARPSFPVAAPLESAQGRSAGNVLLATGPDRMTCVFEGEGFGGTYDVEVLLTDGSVAEVGSFEADGAPWSWTVRLPVPAADVRTVRVLDGDGVLRATAELD